MNLDEVVNVGTDVLLEIDGEDIEYRPEGHAFWDSCRASVDRNPVGADGEFLANTVDIAVRASDVTEDRPHVKLDKVRVTTAGEKAEYFVSLLLQEWRPSQGHWLLRCTR